MTYRDNEGNVPASAHTGEYMAWRLIYDAERAVRLAASQSELPRWTFYSIAFFGGIVGWCVFFFGGAFYLALNGEAQGAAGIVAIVGAVVLGCAVTLAIFVKFVGIPLAAWWDLEQAVPPHLKKAHAHVRAGHPVT